MSSRRGGTAPRVGQALKLPATQSADQRAARKSRARRRTNVSRARPVEIGERRAEHARGDDPPGHVAAEGVRPPVQRPHGEREGQGGERQRKVGEPRPRPREILDVQRHERQRIEGGEDDARPRSQAFHWPSAQAAFHATTRWSCRPSPSIPSDIVSPAFRNRGGFLPDPTPGGVPVVMTSPGSSSDELRDVGDERLDPEHHRRGRAGLHALAADVEPHVERLNVFRSRPASRATAPAGRRWGRSCPSPTGRTARAGIRAPTRRCRCNSRRRGKAPDFRSRSSLREPITIASSTSQSVFTEPFGIMTSSFGPTTQLGALLNSTGSLGTGMPNSAAWSA